MTLGNIVVKPKLDPTQVAAKRTKLDAVAKQLKTEFFGLDEIIDKVINAISAWYIFPEIITRPVIVNLWGMTGVGKTQIVRRIVALLQFSEKFVEVQMDGGSAVAAHSSTLTSILGSSTIEEGSPGILLLDEIQRFRTVDDYGADVKLDKFKDVWTLLSDGRFSADSSMFSEMEMMMAYREWQQDNDKANEKKDENSTGKPARVFKIYPYEAKNFKKLLRLTEPVSEIMKWDANMVSNALERLRNERASWEIDYSKLLIFISGNLDNAFTGANSTEDCDTDADFYHERTKKITSSDIKSSLKSRFRPEQIARLGNTHIIYPSMSRASYQQLIRSTCQRYIDEMADVSGMQFELDESICQQIYDNAVYPTQGTRPVFSSIHMIFSSVLVNVTFWALETSSNKILLAMTSDAKSVVATNENGAASNFAIDLELNNKREKTSMDRKTLVAVHEAGHALVYSVLTKAAPLEVKINPASFEGGYMLPATPDQIQTKQDILDHISTLLAGTAAESIVYGNDHRSSGAGSDLRMATSSASTLIRKYGLDTTLAVIDAEPGSGSTNWVTDLDKSNFMIEEILQKQFTRAKTILNEHKPVLTKIVNKLLEINTLNQADYIELLSPHLQLATSCSSHRFHALWLAHQ